MKHKTLRLLGIGLLAALGASCADDDLYAMFERYEIVGEQRVFAGGGCVHAVEGRLREGQSTSASGGGSVDGDFALEQQSEGDGLRVVVRSGTRELARRDYDEAFLASGEVDRFQVTTDAGKVYELAYWGGPTCDTSHVPPE